MKKFKSIWSSLCSTKERINNNFQLFNAELRIFVQRNTRNDNYLTRVISSTFQFFFCYVNINLYNFYIPYYIILNFDHRCHPCRDFFGGFFFSTEFSDREFFFSTRLASPAHLGTSRSKKRMRRRNSRKNNTDCNTVGTRTVARAVSIGICAVRLSTICYCRCATMPLFFSFFFFFLFPFFWGESKI